MRAERWPATGAAAGRVSGKVKRKSRSGSRGAMPGSKNKDEKKSDWKNKATSDPLANVLQKQSANNEKHKLRRSRGSL